MIIVIIMFVDRKEELERLKEKLESDKFELIIIYGRRRIGKTRLILEAVKNMEHIYYLAVEGDNLRHFKRFAMRVVPQIEFVKEDWEAYFNFLRDKIIVIDEFPNLIKEDPKIISLFQRIVDLTLKDTKTKLILLGSSISMINDKVLSYRSPLYGRKTSTIKLKPLKFLYLREFFPRASWEELVEIYGFADGMPYYLEKINLPFWKWLQEELKKSDSFLKDEVDFLMRYEFENVSVYKKILEAIAFGKVTPKEIKDYLRVKHSDITPYLRNLIWTEFIIREVPITESITSKKGRYFLKDNFLAFWFRFIYPNLSAIEEGIFSSDEIRKEYPHYLGSVFEKVAKEFLIELNKKERLPFRFTKIGKWWHKSEEIDLVALNEKEKKVLFVEVKWKELTIREIKRILTDLKRKSELVGLENYEKYFGIVAKRIKEKEALDEGYLVFDLEDFEL